MYVFLIKIKLFDQLLISYKFHIHIFKEQIRYKTSLVEDSGIEPLTS